MKFSALLVPTTANQQSGMMTEWHPGGHHWLAAIKNPDGSYNGQTAYAYEQRKNLWSATVRSMFVATDSPCGSLSATIEIEYNYKNQPTG